jgi:hypothetical protein
MQCGYFEEGWRKMGRKEGKGEEGMREISLRDVRL